MSVRPVMHMPVADSAEASVATFASPTGLTVVPTEQAARESVAIARSHGEKFFEQIVWQVENEVWTLLGYASWDEMREGEYGDMGVVAPRADRPELVARLRSRGLTQKQIGNTLGISDRTVRDHLSTGDFPVEDAPTVTNSRGQQRPGSYQVKTKTSEETTETFDPATGELIEDDEPTAPVAQPMPSLPPAPKLEKPVAQLNAEQCSEAFGRSVFTLARLETEQGRQVVLDAWERGAEACSPATRDYITPERFRKIGAGLIALADEWRQQ